MASDTSYRFWGRAPGFIYTGPVYAIEEVVDELCPWCVHDGCSYLLQPTKGQARRLDHLLWQQRLLYNAAVEERKKAWQDEHRSVSRYEQFAGLNGMAQTRPDLAGWKLDAHAQRLYVKGVGHIRAKLHRGRLGRAKTAIIKREGRRWWVIVQCDQVEPKPLPPTAQVIGIDLGVAHTLTTSNGEHVANHRFAKRAAVGLADAQRDLARKQRGSARRRKAVGRVAAQHRKVRDCRRDYAHQLSRWLIDNHDVIVHEKLAITNMVASAKGSVGHPGTNVAAKSGLNRSIHDAGWGQLLAFVAYKAEDAGRHIEAVDPRNTSRTCSSCGHCEEGNRHTQALFRCRSCGHQAHADTNAALNILRAGLAQRLQREAREQAACQTRDLFPCGPLPPYSDMS